MKTDFLMIVILVILQGVPGLGATRVAYRTKKKVYVAFSERDVKRAQKHLASGAFLTASAHENERLGQIHDEPVPEDGASKP